jgi:type IV secretion system protein VirB1
MLVSLALLIATCASQVHPTTMQALIAVESAGNPYAVSINRPASWIGTGRDLPVFYQPRTVSDAQQLVTALHATGFTTSVGLAQINTEHLRSWQLPIEALFDPCTNLQLAERILLDCDSGVAPVRLPQLLSCFNSGNASTGIANGYAARVYRAALKTSSPRSASR